MVITSSLDKLRKLCNILRVEYMSIIEVDITLYIQESSCLLIVHYSKGDFEKPCGIITLRNYFRTCANSVYMYGELTVVCLELRSCCHWCLYTIFLTDGSFLSFNCSLIQP